MVSGRLICSRSCCIWCRWPVICRRPEWRDDPPALDFRENVRGENDRRLAFQIIENGVEAADGFRIEPVGGFIQEQQLRIAQQCLRETQSRWRMPLSNRSPGASAACVASPPVPAWRRNGPVAILSGGQKLQGFQAGEVVGQHDIFRQIADFASHAVKPCR